MQNYEEMLLELANAQKYLTKKQQRKAKMDVMVRLIKRLNEDAGLNAKIEQESPQFFDDLQACYEFLAINIPQRNIQPGDEKIYNTHFKNITDALSKKYDLYPKGTYIGQYLAIGIAIGAGVGMVLASSNASFYSIGASLGLVFGIAIGNSVESSKEKAGKIY